MPTDLIYAPTAVAVADAILMAGAYRMKRPARCVDDFFIWENGIRAPVYTDCRILNRNPVARTVVAEALAGALSASFPAAEIVVGLAEAGIFWSSLVANELNLAHAFVRKSPKPYGVPGRMLEGDPPRRLKAVIVDDAVATGATAMRAVAILEREAGIETIGILSVVNWDFPVMRENLVSVASGVRALMSRAQFFAACTRLRMLPPPALQELEMFYEDPKGHIWDIVKWNEPALPVDN